jgi:hypothetical protein
LDDRRDALQGLLGVQRNVLGRHSEKLIDLLGVVHKLVGVQFAPHGLLDVAVHAGEVPQTNVLLEVLHNLGYERWRNKRIGTQRRVFGVVEVRLNVRQVILLGVRKGGLPDCHRHILVSGVDLHGRRYVGH